jgi:hypothetical protein
MTSELSDRRARIEGMRKFPLVSLLLFAALAAPVMAQLQPPPDADGPLLHLGHRAGGHSLRLVDPLTLEPRSRKLPALRHGYGGALSPDRRRLARGTAWGKRSRIQVINLARWREERIITLGRGGPVLVQWPSEKRLIALVGEPFSRQEAVVVDPDTGAVKSRRAIRGRLLSHAAVARGVALLVAPERGLGPARLVLVDVSGTAHTVRLERIRSGGNEGARRRERYRNPALAVDPAGVRAYVVAAAGSLLVAEVDLASAGVTYREPTAAVGGRPRAQAAKGNMRVWWRDAAWFGGHSIAVTGYDSFPTRRGRRFPPPIEPYGLRVIDTTDWTARTLDRRPDQAFVAGERLLAHGSRWSPPRLKYMSSSGLLGFTEDGHRSFIRFAGRQVTVIGTHGRLAYVWVVPAHELHVIDVRDGRTLRKMPARARNIPVLLSAAG